MSEDLKIQISAQDLTGQAFANVQKQLGDIAEASQASAKQMGELANAAGALAQKGADLAGFGSGVVNLLRGGAVVGAIALALNELKKFNDEIVQSIAKAVEQSAELGITVARYQAVSYALSKVGVDQAKADAIQQTYTQHLRDAVAGKGAAIDAFENLGVKILDNTGKLRNSGDTMAETARAILAMKDADQQAAAAKDLFGLSITRAVPVLKQLAVGADDLERNARAAHVVLDEKIAKSIEATTHHSGQAALAIKGLYAEIALPIFLHGIDELASRINLLVKLFNQGKFAADQFFKSIPGNLADLGAANATAARAKADADIADLEKKIAAGADPGSLRRQMDPESVTTYRARLEQQLAQRRAERAALASEEEKAAARASAAWLARGQGDVNKADLDRLLSDGLPARDRGKNPDKVDPGGKGGGAAGDRIETAINRLEGEREAAETALERMMAGTHLPLDDLERQIALEKKIADEVARLGATKPDDPRIGQIRTLVTATQEAESAFKKFDQSSKDAVQTEKQLGDGTLYLATEQRRLNEQLASGRLDLDTWGIAMRDATEKAEDMRLKNLGAQGGFEGLVAGMQYAANQFERNGRVFQNGQKIFDGVMSAMDQAVNEFVQKGEVNFGKLAASFITMIIQMEMRAAASAVWGAIGPGITGFFGSMFGSGAQNSSQIGAPTSAYNPDLGLGSGTGFAAGGDPPVGVPSWVGEQGPELFVPKNAGTIFNREQLAGMGGDSINIVQNFSFGSDVNQGTLRSWAEQIKKDTISSLVYAKRSGNAGLKKAFG